jgi:iron complex transport system substrate-binding protein
MKRLASIFLALTLIITAAGCGNQAKTGAQSSSPSASTAAPSKTAPTAETPVTVKDSREAEITFDAIPEKVVSLMPSDTEILYALDSGDKIIAVSDYCNYPADTANKKKLPTGEQLDTEALIELNPDVVFIGKMSAMDDQIKQVEDAGIKVVVTEANDLAGTYKVIEMVGSVMGKNEEAAGIVDSMKKGFDRIREEVKGKEPKKVYVEVSPLQFGLWSCGKNTFVQELIDIAGAKNIFDDLEGWAAVSEEQVLERDPEIILTTASPLTGINDPVGEIRSRANWSGISAVKNNKVIMLDADMSSRPGPRLLDAAEELVKAIYSE